MKSGGQAKATKPVSNFHLPHPAKERLLWLCGVLVELEDMEHEHCCVSIGQKYHPP